MNKYAQILMSRWRGVPTLQTVDTSKRPKLINQDEMNVTYPINEITKNRDASIVRAMDASTPPLVRQQILANIESLPPDHDVSRLSDDDKLSVMKSRYCQSRPEIADFNEYLSNLVESGRLSATPATEPAKSADPVSSEPADPATSEPNND